MLFIGFTSFIILQRLTELWIARKNEERMKQKGALEFGAGHYPWMVLLHTGFFLSLILEVLILDREPAVFSPVLLACFLLAQMIRIWALLSLGPYWNTKILVMPGASVVRKGPYRFMKHPNYLVVAIEIFIIPLMFNAWLTALIFSLLNGWMMSIRIPLEEKALTEATSYGKEFKNYLRFIPKL